MAGTRQTPEEIVSKLRQVEVLQGQGVTVAEAVRQVGVTQQTFYRWHKLYGGMGRSQLKRLKDLEKENQRLRRPVRCNYNQTGPPMGAQQTDGQYALRIKPDRSCGLGAIICQMKSY
jgi:hypothetical protein